MRKSAEPGRSHRAQVELLPALIAGILEPGAEVALRRHLEECPRCRDVFEALDVPPDVERDPAEHLPPGLMACWQRVAPLLRGLERRLVREHLDRCPTCREELESLGHAPFLVADDEAEASRQRPEPSAPSAGKVARASRPRIGPGPVRPDFGRAVWSWGGWGAAAAAAAFILVTRTPLTPIVPIPDRAATPTPITSPVPSATAPPATPHLGLAVVAELPTTVRGGRESEIPATRIATGTRTLALALPDLGDWEPTTSARVELRSPGGEVLAGFESSIAELRRASAALVYDGGPRPLAPGTYRLEVVVRVARGGADTLRVPFRVLIGSRQ